MNQANKIRMKRKKDIDHVSRRSDSDLVFHATDISELRNIILSLKNRKSMGIDDMPSEILRVAVEYRPTSLISNVEKDIKARLDTFFEKNNVLSKFQFGFREQKSTKDAIARLISCVYEVFNRNRLAICFMIDLAKAFDTVEHELLLSVLDRSGCEGNRLEFDEIISNRS